MNENKQKEALKNADLINETTFAFSVAPLGQASAIDFGSYDPDRIKSGETMLYIDLNEDFFWSAQCQGFALGTTENAWKWGSVKGAYQTVGNGMIYSIFDTGSSAIIIPEVFFGNFLDLIYAQMEGKEHEVEAGYVVTKCYPDFPTMFFLFDEKWIAVEPAEYVIDVSENKDRSLCVLLISPGQEAFLVMGLPLYMNYYTVHEDIHNRIGFAPHASSPKKSLTLGT